MRLIQFEITQCKSIFFKKPLHSKANYLHHIRVCYDNQILKYEERSKKGYSEAHSLHRKRQFLKLLRCSYIWSFLLLYGPFFQLPLSEMPQLFLIVDFCHCSLLHLHLR